MQRNRQGLSLPRPQESGPSRSPLSPEILLVGPPSRRLESVAASLAPLHAETRRLDPTRIPDASWERCLGVVVVATAPEPGVSDSVEQVLSMCPHHRIPVFVVLGETISPSKVRRLHRAAVAAVFRWPAESMLLPDAVARIIAAQQVRGRPTKADATIARALRARLQPQEEPGEEVVVAVRDRIASAFGTADSLWRRNRILDTLAHVPRLRRVEADDLRVAPAPVPDEEMARSIRGVIRAASTNAAKTLAVSVHRGFVTLAGTAVDRGVTARLVDIISRIRGVRGIEVLTTISPRHQERERRRAGEIGKDLERRCRTKKVDVAVFGHTGVLSGVVDTPRERSRLEHLVVRHPSIRKVVNQLRVA